MKPYNELPLGLSDSSGAEVRVGALPIRGVRSSSRSTSLSRARNCEGRGVRSSPPLAVVDAFLGVMREAPDGPPRIASARAVDG